MGSLAPWMVKTGAVLLGAALGYGWYRLVGCSTGACPITSNPWTSTGYGAVLGFLAVWDK
jgi:hypothetical protein